MKQSPDIERLEAILRSSKLVRDGFLGRDTRRLEDILDADAAAVARTGRSIPEIAGRMRFISTLARQGLGTTVTVETGLQAYVIEARGVLVCPWPHPGRFPKTIITATRCSTGQSVRWSDLNVHMIEAHGFFEGRGSTFRLEPEELAAIIF